MTMSERIAKWAAWWRAQPKRPTQGERELADAARQRQLGETFLDEVARSIVVKGCYVPGEPFDDVPTQPGGLRMFGMEAWVRQERDMDWQARVDEAQRQEIANGGRG
jgi:hypothetical protein